MGSFKYAYRTQPSKIFKILCTLIAHTQSSLFYYSQVNNSFVMGIFNGELRPEEVFPFPEVLTEEQNQNISMFLGPVEKFYEVLVVFN